MVVVWAGQSLFKCPMLFGVLNNFKHFTKNVVSNTIVIVTEWN
jgi:hypothetical protein